MAIAPELPKKPHVRVSARDLKAKKNPKGGAQKKEIGLSDRTSPRSNTSGLNRLA